MSAAEQSGATKSADVVVVGAGAAGLLAALAARGAVGDDGGARDVPDDAPSVLVLDASPKIGLKILASGGGRCNVTNAHVDERDFETDAPHLLRGHLAGFDVDATRHFFESRGLRLYEEPLGKLFPETDDAGDVLRTLLSACVDAGADLRHPVDVVDVAPKNGGETFVARTADGDAIEARRVVIATGGKSLPKTGSRGFGYEVAARLGHATTPPLPALTPLLFGEDSPFLGCAGVTHPIVFSVVPKGTTHAQATGAKLRPTARGAGSCVLTHAGASGPAALDVSGACARALHDGEPIELRADVWSLTMDDRPYAAYLDSPKPPGCSLPPKLAPRPPTFDEFVANARPDAYGGNRRLAAALSRRVPRALVEKLIRHVGVDPDRPAKTATALDWKRVHEALTWVDARVVGVDGYGKAEVTCGGVALSELGRSTLESKIVAGLYFCGEVVDVTGRLGGFNFQWAWASGFAAGRAAAASLRGARS
jgi:predicted Rossmann fold flavoprotein